MTTLLPSLVAFVFSSVAAFAATASKPNIIFILADDLGIDGVSCYGSDKHKTQHIDKLAASGTRFETCCAAPLCGPTRALLLTGRYAFRTVAPGADTEPGRAARARLSAVLAELNPAAGKADAGGAERKKGVRKKRKAAAAPSSAPAATPAAK